MSLVDILGAPLLPERAPTSAVPPLLIFICPHCTKMFYFSGGPLPVHATQHTASLFQPCDHFRGIQTGSGQPLALFEAPTI